MEGFMIKIVIFSLISISSVAFAQYDNNEYQIYQNGEYKGNINDNPYDPNSINNTTGRYGNSFSPDSIKNPYSASHFNNGNNGFPSNTDENGFPK